jgi:O-antigen ligase
MPHLRAVKSSRHPLSPARPRLRSLLTQAVSARRHVYYLLVGYLSLVFLLGGGARHDIQSLIFLRPLAVMICGAGLLTLRWDDLRRYRFIAVMAFLVLLLALLHIVPLPPAVWQGLAGRGLVTDIEQATGLADIWRPLSLTPTAAQNAFYSLFVPLGAFLLAVQLEPQDQQRLIRPLLVIGAISGLMGILQIVGSPNGPLYLYRITNNGQSVGLFSNRNHQAVFLAALFPLLAFYASQTQRTDDKIKIRLVICAAAAAILVPLVLVTGSRQGLLLGMLSLGFSFLIFERPQATLAKRRGAQKNFGMMFISIFAALALAVITAIASRAEALNRLIATDIMEEGRGKAWQIVVKLIADYFPFGSGSGSFVEAYQIAEPLGELRPTYFNHAHNDFLEVALTFGLPGIVLILFAIVAFARAAGVLLRRKASASTSNRLARTGLGVVLIIGLASFVDYPLRTPSIACFFVIATCWIYAGLTKSAEIPLASSEQTDYPPVR